MWPSAADADAEGEVVSVGMSILSLFPLANIETNPQDWCSCLFPRELNYQCPVGRRSVRIYSRDLNGGLWGL